MNQTEEKPPVELRAIIATLLLVRTDIFNYREYSKCREMTSVALGIADEILRQSYLPTKLPTKE